VGTSQTTGQNNVVCWAGLHHKTNTQGGTNRFGWPDETYFVRVKDELKMRGVELTQEIMDACNFNGGQHSVHN
jgi:deltex